MGMRHVQHTGERNCELAVKVLRPVIYKKVCIGCTEGLCLMADDDCYSEVWGLTCGASATHAASVMGSVLRLAESAEHMV